MIQRLLDGQGATDGSHSTESQNHSLDFSFIWALAITAVTPFIGETKILGLVYCTLFGTVMGAMVLRFPPLGSHPYVKFQ